MPLTLMRSTEKLEIQCIDLGTNYNGDSINLTLHWTDSKVPLGISVTSYLNW